jgi:uncharacterized protein YdhG (YjbR/CyaY superfamily)
MDAYTNIDAYIAQFPAEVQEKLAALRKTIHEAAPGAKETISYGIPTFDIIGHVVHFAAYKNHIGFYPGASGMEAFKEKLSAYKCSKGTVQFPIDKPLPYDLISEIVRFRVAEDRQRNKKGMNV